MSSPARILVKLLGQVLWLLVRLLVLALTGEWVTKRQLEPAGGEAAAGASGEQPAQPGSRAASAAQVARLAGWLASAENRAAELRRRARTTAAADGLETLLSDTLSPLIAATGRELAAGRTSRALIERVQALEDALQSIGESLTARAQKRAATLADTETIATSLAEPMYAHARAENLTVRERVFVALPHVDGAGATRLSLHTPIQLVGDAMGDAQRLAWLARVVARTLVQDVPALTSDLLRAHALPPGMFVPGPGGHYDPDTARAALGVWLPELVTEVLATFMLGPAYVQALAGWLARPEAPLETRVAGTQGRWLSAEPPRALRLFAAVHALEVLGFRDEAEHIHGAFEAAHGPLDALYYPIGDGSAAAIPAAFVLEELAPVLDALCTEPLDALGDVTLLDVPGFAYLHGEHARASEAAARFLRGETSRHAARECAAGAVLAVQQRAELNAQVLAALSGSVRGTGTLEAVGAPAAVQAPAPRGRPRTVREAARDPREVRAAMMLTAALGRPRLSVPSRPR